MSVKVTVNCPVNVKFRDLPHSCGFLVQSNFTSNNSFVYIKIQQPVSLTDGTRRSAIEFNIDDGTARFVIINLDEIVIPVEVELKVNFTL